LKNIQSFFSTCKELVPPHHLPLLTPLYPWILKSADAQISYLKCHSICI
jgi:hypothetical protein